MKQPARSQHSSLFVWRMKKFYRIVTETMRAAVFAVMLVNHLKHWTNTRCHAILSTYHFVNLSFYQLAVLPTGCYAQLPSLTPKKWVTITIFVKLLGFKWSWHTHVQLNYSTLEQSSYTQKEWQETRLIGFHHSPDGITNPKYKLLCFIATKFFAKRRMH